jgi:FkbM family methyltransferase
MFRAIKQQLRRQRLHQLGIREDLNWTKRPFGDGDGAWTIYPDQLDADSVVYSFGVGTNISFDCALIQSFGVRVHAFDPTPIATQWLAAQKLPKQFHFHAYGVAGFDGSQEFQPPRRAGSSHYSPVKRYRHSDNSSPPFQGDVRRVGTIMETLGHRRIDLLKMDIEGGESEVIDDVLNDHIPVAQLAVEFHHSYASIPFTYTVRAVQRLRECNFSVLHISPRTYEITFVNAAFYDA